jgi:uncharacterized membrane protein
VIEIIVVLLCSFIVGGIVVSLHMIHYELKAIRRDLARIEAQRAPAAYSLSFGGYSPSSFGYGQYGAGQPVASQRPSHLRPL